MLEYIETLLSLTSVEEIWAHHCRFMDDYGFDRLLYGYTRFQTQPNLLDLDETIVLSNHEKCYIKALLDGRLYADAPMIQWAWENEGWESWGLVAQKLQSGTLDAASLKVLELNRRYDILAGISIGFPQSNTRARGGIGLCARKGLSQTEVDQIWCEHQRTLLVACQLMHMRLSSLPYIPPKRHLSPRQREVLEWIADGKTAQDVACLMGLTVTTVEKHLRLARESLNVETTAQAVLKAAVMNQIFQPQHGAIAAGADLKNHPRV
ncbi:LuxR family transcriptional regulator [Thioclava sp. GXIMD4216]|uniref:helix-turn-helix transcriptional regulator n=1 Tax=Thioclava sp. GXIMD4216 TaxID=3131929 RepID=UPI0030D0CA80